MIDSPSYKGMILTQKQEYNNFSTQNSDRKTNRPKSTESKYNYCSFNRQTDIKMTDSNGTYATRPVR